MLNDEDVYQIVVTKRKISKTGIQVLLEGITLEEHLREIIIRKLNVWKTLNNFELSLALMLVLLESVAPTADMIKKFDAG